jgi:iduronate 2-sulfatase
MAVFKSHHQGMRSVKYYPFLLIVLALATFTTLNAEDKMAAADRPNVLLIMVDDLRDYGGAFTRNVVKTPNLDRLRAHGTTFGRAYVQYPVCNPSRSGMMTGLRAEQTGIVNNNTRLREKMPDIITMPQLCKKAGWQSHAFGKLYNLGGGNNLEANQALMDVGKSWHTAKAFEATK